MDLKDIEKGDFLVLQDVDSLLEVVVKEVISINNPDIDEDYFQIRPKGLDYDFLNFYTVIHVIKKFNKPKQYETLN